MHNTYFMHENKLSWTLETKICNSVWHEFNKFRAFVSSGISQAFHGNAPVEFTPEQARKMLDDFALHYPDVKQWRKHMIERLKKTVPGLKDV